MARIFRDMAGIESKFPPGRVSNWRPPMPVEPPAPPPPECGSAGIGPTMFSEPSVQERCDQVGVDSSPGRLRPMYFDAITMEFPNTCSYRLDSFHLGRC